MVKNKKQKMYKHYTKYKNNKSKTNRPRITLDGKKVDLMSIAKGKVYDLNGKKYPLFSSRGLLSKSRKSKEFIRYEQSLKENPSRENYIRISTEIDKKLTAETAGLLYDFANDKEKTFNPMMQPFKSPKKKTMKSLLEIIPRSLTTLLDYFFGTNVQKFRDDMDKVGKIDDVISNLETLLNGEEFVYTMGELKKEKPDMVKKILANDPDGKLFKKTIIDFFKKAQEGGETVTYNEYIDLYSKANEKYLTDVSKLELPTMVDSAKALGKIAGKKIKEKAKKIMEDGIKVGVATGPLVKFYNDVAGISLRQAQTRYDNYDMSLAPQQGAKLGVDALKAGTALISGMVPTVAMAAKVGQNSGRKLRGTKEEEDDLEVINLDTGKRQDTETGEDIEEPTPTPTPTYTPSPSEPPKQPSEPTPEEITIGEEERARDKAGDVQEEQQAREELEADFIPDVSKYGHTLAVQNIFTRYNKDFTYFKNLIANNPDLKPSDNLKKRKSQVDRIIAEYSSLFPIEKVNSNYSFDECLEIITLEYCYIKNIRFENSWKRALINNQMGRTTNNNETLQGMQRAFIVQQPNMGTLGNMTLNNMNTAGQQSQPQSDTMQRISTGSGTQQKKPFNIIARPQKIKPKSTRKKTKIFNDKPMVLNIRKRTIPNNLLFTNLAHQPSQQNIVQFGQLPVMRVKDRKKTKRFKL